MWYIKEGLSILLMRVGGGVGINRLCCCILSKDLYILDRIAGGVKVWFAILEVLL